MFSNSISANTFNLREISENSNRDGLGTVRGNHPTLVKVTAIYMHR